MNKARIMAVQAETGSINRAIDQICIDLREFEDRMTERFDEEVEPIEDQKVIDKLYKKYERKKEERWRFWINDMIVTFGANERSAVRAAHGHESAIIGVFALVGTVNGKKMDSLYPSIGWALDIIEYELGVKLENIEEIDADALKLYWIRPLFEEMKKDDGCFALNGSYTLEYRAPDKEAEILFAAECPYDEDIEKVPEKITFDDPRMWFIEL